MDNTGFQKKAKKKILPPRKLDGSFMTGCSNGEYSKPLGQWNQAKLVCNGPIVSFDLNGKNAFRVNLNEWKEAGKNPDGSSNKFKTALKDLPRTGRMVFRTMDGLFGLETSRSKNCKMKSFLPVCFFLFVQIISSASENWSRFRGNNGDGRADFTIPPVWEKSDYRWSL